MEEIYSLKFVIMVGVRTCVIERINWELEVIYLFLNNLYGSKDFLYQVGYRTFSILFGGVLETVGCFWQEWIYVINALKPNI